MAIVAEPGISLRTRLACLEKASPRVGAYIANVWMQTRGRPVRVSGTAEQIHSVQLLEGSGVADPLNQLPFGDKVYIFIVSEQVINNADEASSMMFVVEPGRVVVQSEWSSV